MAQAPHLPRRALIDAYGKGGFRFGGMSHRGSLLCVPSGIWAWSITAAGKIDEAALAQVFAEASDIDMFLLGTGLDPWSMPDALLWQFRDRRIVVDVTSTGAAVRTYNIVLAEGRRVAAGLIAVD